MDAYHKKRSATNEQDKYLKTINYLRRNYHDKTGRENKRGGNKKTNSNGAGNFQYIKPFFPNDLSVIKMTGSNGEVKYYQNYPKNEIRACSTDLETVLMCLLEPIDVFEKALVYDDHIEFANTLTTIRQNIANNIHEIFRFVNNIGEIQITSIHKTEVGSIYRWGQCVNAELLPPDKFEEKPMFDHDPELIEELKQMPPDKTKTIKAVIRHISCGKKIQFQYND